MQNDHWSQSSHSFKVGIFPAVPTILTIPLILLAVKVSSFFWIVLAAIWLYIVIFVWIFKVHPRHSGHLIRRWLVGKNKNAKNENSPLQY